MTMLSVRIDQSDPTTLHDQVAAEIRRAIAAGRLRRATGFLRRRISPPCSASTRTCAACVSSAAPRGAARISAGKGITVAGAPERGLVLARARELVSFARSQGVRPDELARLIEQIASKPSIDGTGQ